MRADPGLNPVPLEAAADASLFGGKASQLARALVAGLPVPRGYALSHAAVESASRDPSSLRAFMAALPEGVTWAVRSSALGEDSAAASFSGQHASYLGVAGAESLLEAVRKVRESAHDPGALAYRRKLGLVGDPAMAVVLQEMAAAETSGVMFTEDPLTARPGLHIEAAWGFGETVVRGIIEPDRYRLDPQGTVLSREPGLKDLAIVQSPTGGTREVAVDACLHYALCLDDHALHGLLRIAEDCERLFGPALDIEWAIADGKVFLLQCRPIVRRAS
jgi:pyruvate,water dikinase